MTQRRHSLLLRAAGTARNLVILVALLAVLASSAAYAAADAATVAPKILTLLEAVSADYDEAMSDGKIVRPLEYDEATGFLDEARSRWRTLGESNALAITVHEEVDSILGHVARAIADHGDPQAISSLLDTARQTITLATGIQSEVFPGEPASAQRGRALFAENCSTCHGERGDGQGESAANLNPHPANFTDATFMRGETPYDFYHVITLGKRNSAMPAWGDVLTIQERWDLVAHLWTLPASAARTAEGQGIYLTQCANCHGPSANGEGPWASDLMKPPSNLTLLDKRARVTDADTFAAITDGIAGSPMPSFARVLSDDERWKVVAFLRSVSFGGRPPSGGGGAGESGSRAGRAGKLARFLGRSYASAFKDGILVDASELEEAKALAVQLRVATTVLVGESPLGDGLALRTAVGDLENHVQRVSSPAAVGEAADRAVQHADKLIPPDVVDLSGAGNSTIESALAESNRLLDAVVGAYGKPDGSALGFASDAYFAFEPVESHLSGVAPALKSGVEEKFLALRQAVKKPDALVEITTIIAAIRSDYAAVRHALAPKASASGLILQSAGIVLREGFEIVLVIGMLLGYVVKAGQPQLRRLIQAGVAAGVAASLVTAFAFGELLRRNPGSASILEAATMLLAAMVLFWVSYWLVSKAEADKWQKYIRGKVHGAIAGRRRAALVGAAFLAVYREGFETVLFYRALYASAPGGAASISIGIAVGGVALTMVYVLFRRFQGRVPIGQFFVATGIFLYVMAATFAAQAVYELQEVGYVTTTSLMWMPTIPLLGLFPTVETTLVQVTFLALLLYALVRTRRRKPEAQPAAPTPTAVDLGALEAAVRELTETTRKVIGQNASGQRDAMSERLENLCRRLDEFASRSQAPEPRA